MGARMSALPIAQYCGQAPKLGEKHGAGRAAAMSTAFHALCANDNSKLAFLTQTEKDEIATWKRPADIVISADETLRYADADKELTVGLDTWGGFTTAESQAITIGHLDFAWATKGGVAFVLDIKKTIWTTSDGPESLQLHAYAMAYSELRGCHSYVTGLWIAEDGEYLFAKEPVDLGSARARQIWSQIDHAAMNDGGFATGPHCRNCWSRLHCPEYIFPALCGSAIDKLSALALGQEMPEDAFDIWAEIRRCKDVYERAEENLKEAVRRGATKVVDPENGQRWAQLEMPGRKSLDRKKLEADGIDLTKYESLGRPYTTARWVNAK